MADVYYGDLWGKEEIVEVGLLLSKYQRQQIDYVQFQDQMLALGYSLDVEPIDSSKLMRLADAQSLEERIKNKTIEARDIHRFYATSDKFGRVFFLYDRLMIDQLADFGDEFAMDIRESLLRFENRFRKNNSSRVSRK